MRLLPDSEFSAQVARLRAAAGDDAPGGGARADGDGVFTVSSDPAALAAVGGGDDPDACAAEAGDDPGVGAAGAGPAGRRGGGEWRALWLADAFRAAGLHVVEVAGWRSRGYAFAHPPMVSLFHHTGSSRRSGPAGGLNVVVHGRPGLDGPIANWLTARDGTVYVIASGVAYNAGHGNARAAGLPNVAGNGNTLGDEMDNDGLREAYPAVQYTAAIKSHAAVHRHLGWPASRGIGHKEWSTTGKTDPLLNMASVRRDLAAAIAGHPPTPQPTGDDFDMDQKTFNGMFAAALRDPVVARVLGDAVKSAEFGMDPKTGKNGITLGAALLELLARLPKAPA